ncbi:MAG TPA: hypothetical protein VL863_10170, partial [bacterium]|nr:hypothetical protein [bacterium]
MNQRTNGEENGFGIDLLVSEFPSNLVWKHGLGKMGLSCRLQAAGQWRERVRYLLALAVGQV